MPLWIQNVEGLSLIISAVLIFVTLRRKGKNRLLFLLAWLFLAGGVFRLGMVLPGLLGNAVGSDWFARLASVISNTCLYFGLAGYISLQLRYLKGQAAGRMAFWVGMMLAALLTVFHTLAAGLIPGVPLRVAAGLAPYQIQLMLTVFASTFLFLLITFGIFFVRARRQGTSFISNSTMNIGLGFLLISWILQKVVQTEVGSALPAVLAALPFAAIGIVVAAIFLQTSSAMMPGIVYNVDSKQPVGLAVVRVIRTRDQKLLETRVTSAEGRYGILVEPGEYTLSVQATGFSFPTKSDVGYRSEILNIKRPTVLGYDVFLDPVSV